MSAQLLELPIVSALDVPGVLRAMADQIEAGAYGDIDAAVLVTEDVHGNVRTFGAGKNDYYRGLAVLQLGIENLLAKRGRESML